MSERDLPQDTKTVPAEGSPDAPKRSVATTTFLLAYFAELENSGLLYGLMRNFEELPVAKSGNDIDLMVRSVDLQKHRGLLERLATRLGWRMAFAVEKPNICTYRVVSPSLSGAWPSVLMFDFFPGNAWYGARFVEAEPALARREPYGELHCLGLVDRVVCLVLHHLLCTGNIGKEKYRVEIREVLERHEEALTERIRGAVGRSLSARLIDGLRRVVRDGGDGEMPTLQPALRRAVTLKSLLRRPLGSSRDWLRLGTFELGRRWRPSGLVVAIWQELDRESPSRLTEEVLAWLWLLDRRNHALLSGSPPRVLTTPHRYAARRVRDWYGVPEADAAGGGAKKAVRVWRRGVRQAIVLGLVVLLEDRGSNADWDGLAPDVCFVVGTSVDSRAVKEKCAELERQGTPWEFVDVGSAPGPNLASRVAARLQVPLNSSVEV